MDSTELRIPGGNILVVDDDLSARQTLAALMERTGNEVRCTPSGQTALMLAREAPPDVILLDIRLPDMDGLQVCRLLKEDPRTRGIPVIFISALEDVDDKIKGLAAGGVDYITKPFQVEEVLARVKTHLALQRLQNQLERRVEERTADLKRANEELSAANDQPRRESEQREQTEEALKDRLRFEQLLSELSARFVNIPPELVDSEIEEGLQRLLEFFEVDRCGLLRLSEDGTTFQISHVCVAEGIPPVPAQEDLPTALFPWAYQKVVVQQEVVSVSALEDMPPEASIDKQTYREWGIQSHLNIPIVVAGSREYIISINAVRKARAWPAEIIPRLRLLGEIFVNALERKRAERELLESEARFRQVADASPVMIWMSGPDKGCTYLNKGWLEFTGRTMEQELGDGWAEGVHPDDLQRCLDTYAQAFDAREKFSMEYRLRRCDSEYRWIWDIGVPRFVPGGRFEGYIGSCVDITDRRRMGEELQARLREIEALRERLERENVYLREEATHLAGYGGIVGQSEAIQGVLAQARQVAPTDSTVLILGETGTGKELLARAIHSLSPRNGRALVTVNCASLPPTLIESEMFGREKGAYTGALTRMAGRFELADGSTLFLDEIGELPLDVQAKLLRVLQDGQLERLGSTKSVHVNVRLIAASNRDLAQDTHEGTFRKDLYYRLSVFPVIIPPLRERPEDIPLLVWEFIREFGKKMGKGIDSVPRRSLEALQRYPWPGNVRELRNVIEHAMIVSSGRTLEVQVPAQSATEPSAALPGSGSLEDVERRHILDVLQKTGWRITGKGGAAEALGLKRTTLQSRMGKLGIKRPTTDSPPRK